MVRFNKREFGSLNAGNSTALNEEIDWKQFIVDYHNLSVDQAIHNIITKMLTKQGTEFDQMCLILKHYLLIDSNKENSYLSHFLKHEQSTFVVQLIERFNSSAHRINEQWIISEIFKLVSSICADEQADYLISSHQFRSYLLASAFDLNVLQKLKSKSGLSLTESTILSNIFETISNLCEIKNELVNGVSISHIDWIANALVEIHHSNRELTVSLARLFHMITEYLQKIDNSSLSNTLLDFYLNKNFFVNCMSHLNRLQENSNAEGHLLTHEDILSNLNSKLYIAASFVKLILSNQRFESELKLKKSVFLLNILNEFGTLVCDSLKIDLEEDKNNNKSNNSTKNTNKNNSNEMNSVNEEAENKSYFRTFEKAIESKLIAIDLLYSICEYFIKDCDEFEEEDEYESLDESDENDQNNNSINTKACMEIEMEPNATFEQSKPVEDSEILNLKNLIGQYKLLDLLVKAICKDDENSFQESDKIAHIYDSIKLIRTEAAKCYTLIIENFYLNTNARTEIDLSHLFALLDLIRTKSPADFAQDQNETDHENLLNKLSEIIFALFTHFNESKNNQFSLESKTRLIETIKQILFKHKFDSIDLGVKLARIIGLLAIKLRNSNLMNEEMQLVSVSLAANFIHKLSAQILIEMTVASFELADQSKLDVLRLNAELMDLLIDLFGEDNLLDLERELNFLEKIKYFSERFYGKCKQLPKKLKVRKEHSAILTTVKDNFRSFVEYKIKNLK